MSEIELLRANNKRLKKIFDEFEDLMSKSDGVAGLHSDGKDADWIWLRSHGWLPEYWKYYTEMFGR